MQPVKPVERDAVVDRAEECLSRHADSQSPLYEEFKILLSEYEKLLHRLNKIIAISDKYQIQVLETSHQLNKALEQLNKLRKIILPICMYCKKVRTDEDYWQQVESYFHEHIDVMFSHGICPECLKSRHGEILARHGAF